MKVELMLRENNMEIWNGMKTITGCKQRMDSAFDCPVQISTAPACPVVTSTPSLFSAPGTPVSVYLDINTSSAPTDIHATLLDTDGTGITTPSTPSSHIKASELICSTAIAPQFWRGFVCVRLISAMLSFRYFLGL
ncbi:hypothetical protein SRHO_G00259900 [Serrasalmus rhombeus]